MSQRPSEAHILCLGNLQAALRLRLRLHGDHNMPSQMARVLERWLGCWSNITGNRWYRLNFLNSL
ncbi:MAG: hypothetical protein ACI307_08945 [Sodaliphilus sp.]